MSNEDMVILLQCLEKIGYTVEQFEATRSGASIVIEQKSDKK